MESASGPRRNRVTPWGDVIAVPMRGAWLGNRGILHRGTDVVRHHAGIAWIVCVLQFRGHRIRQWAPGHYTPLFFQDEAIALAAGHRPCAQCRRPAFRAFTDALRVSAGFQPSSDFRPSSNTAPPRAPDLDRLLHAQRWRPRGGRRLHALPWRALPDGTFVIRDDGPAIVLGDALVTWTDRGYRRADRRPVAGAATVLTPAATVAVLAAGYPVQIDPVAGELAGQARSSSEGSRSATDV